VVSGFLYYFWLRLKFKFAIALTNSYLCGNYSPKDMKTKRFAGILTFLILVMFPFAAKSQTICFHQLGYVMNGVKHAANDTEKYMYITFDGNRAYVSDAQGYKTSGNIMYFVEQNGSIQTYCAKDPFGKFNVALGQILYNTETGRLNETVMGLTFIYERVSSRPQPQMY